MNILKEIKNKNFCFCGLGRENLALINYLHHQNLLAEIVYADQSNITLELPAPAKQIPMGEMINYDIIFKSPGVSIYQDIFTKIKEIGGEILSPNQLFFDHNPAFKVCVTGSKGKSTFCKLLMELLQSMGINTKAGGNIGVPLMNIIDQKFQVAVIELSSYQLVSLKIKPDIAVITSLFPEHLSWHGSLENYYRDKLTIASGAKEVLIFNDQTDKFLSNNNYHINYQKVNYLIDDYQIKLDSNHQIKINNRYFYPEHLQATLQGALGIALRVAKYFSVNWEDRLGDLQKAVDQFQGLAHRLEVFYNQQGIIAVDDSISTAPEAVIAALEAYSNYEINVFVGGYSKGTSQKVLIDYLNQHPKIKVYCYSTTGKIIYEGLTNQSSPYFQNLAEALDYAWKTHSINEKDQNTLYLLSPGAASFDQFRDFEDRGQQFQKMFLGKINT